MSLLSLAKANRKSMTDTEALLWQKLRAGQLAVKFRRQHVIGNYIVDFVCLEKKLIVECDGGQHSEEVDKQRSDFLANEGYQIVRFWNNDILQNIEGVMQIICCKLEIDC